MLKNRILSYSFFALLLLMGTFFVLPKLMLMQYANLMLSVPINTPTILFMLLQDLMLACLTLALFSFLLKKNGGILLAFIIGSFLVATLLIDMRVRQLWLKPISWQLVKYVLAYQKHLSSGNAYFWRSGIAGTGLTFLRLSFYLTIAWCTLWGVFILLKRYLKQGELLLSFTRPAAKCFFAIGCFLAILVIFYPKHYLYQLQANLLVNPIVTAFQSSRSHKDQKILADLFEQKPKSLRHLSSSPRKILHDMPPFRNVMIMTMESIRWKGLNLEGNEKTPMPILRKLAQEGLLAKCYAPLPHTSKSLYTILTGRYSYPSIEVKEGQLESFSSLFQSLCTEKQSKSFCFSTAYLAFENIGGMLAAGGVKQIVDADEMIGAAPQRPMLKTSFGINDYVLSFSPISKLKELPDPYATIFVTNGAHHPYLYHGKPINSVADEESYWKSVAEMNDNLTEFMEQCQKAGLTKDTLFVFVGDHGQSFGEHGFWIHNNSLFEEEVTVPLIFWAEDGRMKWDETLIKSQADIAPTIADLMDLSDSDYEVQGKSILRHPDSDQPIFLTAYFSDQAYAIVEGMTKYMFWPSTEKLVKYDLVKDPTEDAGELITDPEEKERIIQRINSFYAYEKEWFDKRVALR